ncbi:hypothetical protein C1646_751035 [Rhizophagus diaphanus]|nr:hypothetical protein C1646_751035 [Rhizophagus diaphanus] [Rhizophagus sp. MUCL 43196]
MDKLNSPYKFQLLFRGSRDGLSGEKFHEICDNQYRTVTVIKVKDGKEILRGYNPVECGPSFTMTLLYWGRVLILVVIVIVKKIFTKNRLEKPKVNLL